MQLSKIMDLIPVEGNKGLFRDESSKAILNCSQTDYESYLQMKNSKINEFSQWKEVREKITEIDELKSDVSEMKEMMKLIIKKLDSNS